MLTKVSLTHPIVFFCVSQPEKIESFNPIDYNSLATRNFKLNKPQLIYPCSKGVDMADIQVVFVLSKKAQKCLLEPDFETITDVVKKTIAEFFEERGLTQGKHVSIGFIPWLFEPEKTQDISLCYLDQVTSEKHLYRIQTTLEVLMQSFRTTLSTISGLTTEVRINEGWVFQLLNSSQKEQ